MFCPCLLSTSLPSEISLWHTFLKIFLCWNSSSLVFTHCGRQVLHAHVNTYVYVVLCEMLWLVHLCARSAQSSSSEPCQGPAIPLVWSECPHKAPKGNLSNIRQLEECNQQTRGTEQHRRQVMHWHRRELFGTKAGKLQNRLASAKLHKRIVSHSIC